MNQHGFVIEDDGDGRGGNPAAPELIDLVEFKQAPDRFEERSVQILKDCEAFIIDSPKTFSDADKIIAHGAALIKGINFLWNPICAAANTAHKLATGTKKKLIEPVDQGTRLLGQKMAAYKFAEAKRIAAEQKVLEDKAKKEHEAAIKAQVKEMKKQDAPVEAIQAVKDMKNDPVLVPQKPVQELRSKTGFTVDWEITVIDKAKVPEAFKIVNEAAILVAVRASKGEFKVAGIKITEKTKVTRRGNNR